MPRPDRDKLAKRTKTEILEALDAAIDENDAEHAKRLRAQGRSIMRLMGGRTYEQEMEALHARIAELEGQLEMAQTELRRTRGETVAAYNPTTQRAVQ